MARARDVLGWVAVLAAALAAPAGADEAFVGRFAIEGVDSAGARYAGTLEVDGEGVRRRVRVGERWVEHRGAATAHRLGDDLVELRAEVTPPAGAGLAGAVAGDAPAGPPAEATLRVRLRPAAGQVEARLEAPGYAAEDRGALEPRRFDLAREVRSSLPAHARLRLEVEVEAGPTRIAEEVVLEHRAAGGEVRRAYARLRVGGEDVDVRGVVERLRPGPSWEAGLALLERAGGDRAARRRLEATQSVKTLHVDAPARLFFSDRPVAVGEAWALDPRTLLAFYKVDRIDPARSRAQARLEGVDATPDGPRYRVAVRVELAVLAVQGLELEAGSVFRFEHAIAQTATRHEVTSTGRVAGRQRGGPAFEQRLRAVFEVHSLAD